MTRSRMIASISTAVVAAATAGWLYAQEERPREPRAPGGPEAREGDQRAREPRGPGGSEAREGGQRRGGEFRPPMLAPSLTANENYIFILRGNTLFKYDVKSLKLEGKTELEGFTPPRPPEGGPERGGERGGERSPERPPEKR